MDLVGAWAGSREAAAMARRMRWGSGGRGCAFSAMEDAWDTRVSCCRPPADWPHSWSGSPQSERFTETRRPWIVNAGIECLTFDQLALRSPLGQNTPFKDWMINIDYNRSSNICGPSMANPQSGPVTLQFQRTEYNRTWYMYQIVSGPDYNQVNIADPKQPQMFGYTNVHDYRIYDSLGLGKKLVARAQGLHAKTSMEYDGWFHWSNVVFTDERFQGSSFMAVGNPEGEWAIIGGTGGFALAQGTITTRIIQDTEFLNIKEICIHALLCCNPNITPTDQNL